jgi:transposase InsO family protein
MMAAQELASTVGIKPACEALGIPRSTLYRMKRPHPERQPRPAPPRALSSAERAEVLDTLNSDVFADLPPAQVHASLLDAGIYHCSVRTMYRILAANREVRERRSLRRHAVYAKPELMATAPNQVWSWDITRIKGPVKHSYFQLYVILDIFSRYVVGWMVARNESARLARDLIAATCDKQGIIPGQLVVHADRGAAMMAKTTAQLFADLDITSSHSRPQVSNDNPFSESHFKTIKYRPTFPERFASQDQAVAVCQDLFRWYNREHHHSAIAFMTPEDVHYGRAEAMQVRRRATLEQARQRNPERFVRAQTSAVPKALVLPQAVWINPPKEVSENVTMLQ